MHHFKPYLQLRKLCATLGSHEQANHKNFAAPQHKAWTECKKKLCKFLACLASFRHMTKHMSLICCRLCTNTATARSHHRDLHQAPEHTHVTRCCSLWDTRY